MESWLALISLPVFYFSAMLHELSHGFAACKIGDKTALVEGRLSFNPLKHISLVGSIIVPGALFISGAGSLFGWVKSVPVDISNFSQPQKIRVILAGVFTNLILAIGGFNLFLATNYLMAPDASQLQKIICFACFSLFPINVMLGVFHLLPLAPLDGWALFQTITKSEKSKWSNHIITKIICIFVSCVLIRLILAILTPLIQWVIYLSV